MRRLMQVLKDLIRERNGDGRLVFLDRAEAYFLSDIILSLTEDPGMVCLKEYRLPFYDTTGKMETYERLNKKIYEVMEELFYQPLSCGQCQYGYGCENCKTCGFRVGGPQGEEEADD